MNRGRILWASSPVLLLKAPLIAARLYCPDATRSTVDAFCASIASTSQSALDRLGNDPCTARRI